MILSAGRRQTRKRASLKRSALVDDLRRRVVEGVFPPGSQLPTRELLEAEYAVSGVTVQRALEQLIQDGLVYAMGRRGTFVADHPPHLFRYALVFRFSPSDERWSRFWTALREEAGRMERDTGRELPVFFDGAPGFANGHQALLKLVGSKALAGLIFASTPEESIQTAIFRQPGIPRVLITSHSGFAGVPGIYPDWESLITRALDELISRGRRRIAIVSHAATTDQNIAILTRAMEARQIQMRPEWVLGVTPHPISARNCTNLLMSADPAHRPDGLIISDDNLVEHATAGLISAGVRVPEEVEVVAHCNFPWPTPSVVPARRLGFDAGAVLQACIESIDRQRDGRPQPPLTLVPAVFEDELAKSAAPPGEELSYAK